MSTQHTTLDRVALRLVVALVCYAVATSVWEAGRRAFWFDEVFTVVLAGKHRFAEIVSALIDATDTSGPGFYAAQRLSTAIVADPHVAYRLASAVAVPLTAVLLFLLARRDTAPSAALTAVFAVLGSQLYHGYSVEARPYALMVLALAVAMLAWQRACARRWAVALAVSLVAAIAIHYYAVFSLPMFAAAELARTHRTRRVRWSVWSGFGIAAMTMLAWWPMLRAVRGYYGEHYWSTPSLGKVLSTYDTLSSLGPGGVGLGIALVLTLALAAMLPRGGAAWAETPTRPAPEMLVLAAGFIALPLVVVAVAWVMGGGYADRYAVGCTLGVALGLAYTVGTFPPRVVTAAVLGMAGLFAARELAFWGQGEPGVGLRQGPAMNLHRAVVARAGELHLPVVIGNPLDFVPFVYYNRDSPAAIIGVADHALALKYAGTDSLDRDLVVLERHFPLNIDALAGIVARHPSFLLLTRPGPFSWPATHLTNSGHTLTVIEHRGVFTLFRVDSPRRQDADRGRAQSDDVPASR